MTLKRAASAVSLAGGVLILAVCGARHALLAAEISADTSLDKELASALADEGFTGNIANTLETKLGRRVDARLADLGRLLWFDTITGLNDDNTCGGCHSPLRGLGIRSPSPSASTTTESSARIGRVPGINGAARWC